MTDYHQDGDVQHNAPETLTPDGLVGKLVVMFLVAGVLFGLLLFLFLENWTSLVWGFIVIGVGFGMMILSGVIALNIDDWHGVEVFNPLAKTRRVIFPGLHPKLPWETVGEPKSFRRSISSSETETFATNDSAESMKAKIVIHMRLMTLVYPDGKRVPPEEAARNFIRFHSVDEQDLAEIVRVKIVRMFAQHFGSSEMEELLKVEGVEHAVVNNPDNKKEIDKLEEKYGSDIVVELESSNPDEDTRQLKRAPARAEAIRKASETLREGGKGVNAGRAHLSAMLLDGSAKISEDRLKVDLDISAPDLQNLRTASVVIGAVPGVTGKKGGDKK